MIRFVPQFWMVAALTAFAPAVIAAPDQPDQGRPQTGASAPVAKTSLKKKPAPHHNAAKAKMPDAKVPAVKPAQPPASVAPVSAKPGETTPAEAKTDAGKPVEAKAAPHFASLRASEDFPIQWVFQRRGLPVEIMATFDIWRKIRAFDGTEGWVNQQMLTGRRSVLITGGTRNLRRDPDPASGIVAQLEAGVVAAMSHCNPSWCELKAGGYKGWLKRDELWGVEPDEVIP